MLTWDFDQIRNNEGRIGSTGGKGQKSCSCCVLLDLCHLKHAERAQHLQHHKGRVVLCGENVEDDGDKSSIHGARRISFSSGSSKIPGHDFQTWHDRRSQARKCTCRKLQGCENYRRNARPGVVLVLIIRTDVSVLILFVPIWRPLFFLRASRHTLMEYEKPQAHLFVYLVSCVPYLVTSALVPSMCSEHNSTSSSSLSSAGRGRAFMITNVAKL